jgi:hypothetical protein
VSEKKPDNAGGLSVQTLLISSLAAVAAAVVVPTFWARGSLIATAVTPVIVAVVSEALRRPAQVISTAAPKVARRTGTGLAVRKEQPTGVGARGAGPEQLPGTHEHDGVSPEDPFGLRAAQQPRRRRVSLKMGVATGLAAAVVGAGVVTAAELGLGHSVTSPKRETSLWGGKTHKAKNKKNEATPTPTATHSATQTATPSASATPSVSATPSASPTPTVGASPTPSATATSSPAG